MSAAPGKQAILGILGGLGPLASAEFLKTIYEYSSGEQEQDSPIILMHSDPTFPDRTEALLGGADDEVLRKLTRALYRLIESGAPKIVICCVTMHYLLPRLPPDLRKKIVSLVDVVFEHLLKSRKKHLLICSTGARKLEVFENHNHWPLARELIILPDDEDQHLIHRDLIYQIKKNCNLRKLVPTMESLLSKYATNSFISGCTEIHLLAKHLMTSNRGRGRTSCIDPLVAVAKQVAMEKR